MAGDATSGRDRGNGLSGPEAARKAAELAGGGAAAGWSETRPFLPGEAGGVPPEPPAPVGGEKWRYHNRKKPPKAVKTAAQAAADSVPKSLVGRILAVVVAHSFLVGATILVSVVAFGATGVALLNSTKEKDRTGEVATVGLGGDKDRDDGFEASTGTTTPGPRSGAVASTKTTLPPETTVPPPGSSTTTTTRPRATTTQPPVTDPPETVPETVPPTQPLPLPTIDYFRRSNGSTCRDQRSRRVTFSWSSNGSSASLGPSGGDPVVANLPPSGSWTQDCLPNQQGTTTGAATGSTWVLTVNGAGGASTSTVTIA